MNQIVAILSGLFKALFSSLSKAAPVVVQGPTLGPWPIPDDLTEIKAAEALRLKAYMPTRNDVPTIGWGHTKGVRMGDVITEAEALALLHEDVTWVKRVLDMTVKVELNDNQVAALYSFVFNIGGTNFRTSTLLRKLNQGDYAGAADQFQRWNKQKGKVLRGLTKRRAAEAKLFRKPV